MGPHEFVCPTGEPEVIALCGMRGSRPALDREVLRTVSTFLTRIRLAESEARIPIDASRIDVSESRRHLRSRFDIGARRRILEALGCREAAKTAGFLVMAGLVPTSSDNEAQFGPRAQFLDLHLNPRARQPRTVAPFACVGVPIPSKSHHRFWDWHWEV